MNRRSFIRTGSLGAVATLGSAALAPAAAGGVEVLNPRNRVPVSLIIDDSTALVNLAHFGIPQFAEVFPEQYKQDWRRLPREIPDAFVLEFAEWCAAHGVKGKYSMVPYPACTGWLHRFIPGWSPGELRDSLRLVREVISVDWDIHPEMISHTRVIDLNTGLPYPYASPDYMENWEWSQRRSADELTAYLTYALAVLKEAGLYCEGVTTPGGFAARNIPNLALATRDAVGHVYGAGIGHFFRDVVTDPGQSVAPQVFHARDLEGASPSCAVHIIGCTDDWFGGWDGLEPGSPDRFITEDLRGGRMVEVIDRGEPALMVCHWPGIYFNGEKTGFRIFQEVVKRLHSRYEHLIWMKNSEIARYWAARELTRITAEKSALGFQAPFSARDFTLSLDRILKNPVQVRGGERVPLRQMGGPLQLEPGTWCRLGRKALYCIDLPAGSSGIAGE
jgi:hypothetical protein